MRARRACRIAKTSGSTRTASHALRERPASGSRPPVSWAGATAGLAPRAQLVPSEFLLVLVIPARVPCPAEKSTLKTQLQPGAPRHGCLRILVEDEAKLRLFGSASPTLRAPVIAHGWLAAFAHTQTPKRGGVATSPRIYQFQNARLPPALRDLLVAVRVQSATPHHHLGPSSKRF